MAARDQGQHCIEGLGPSDSPDRALLFGSVADFRGRGDIWTPPGVVCSAVAAAEARALREQHGEVRAFAEGKVCPPDAWLFCARGEADPERALAAPLRPFDAGERDLPAVGGLDVRVADAWIFRVDHWTDLLWANLLALGPALWSRLAANPLRLGWAALRFASLRPETLIGGLVERGRDSVVHRNATVEFSVLGEGARVGAGAVVRGSILQAGAVVEELAMVEGCVVGAEARIQRQAMAKFSVIEPRAAHAGVVQLGVIGAEAQVRQGAVLFDQSLGDPVRVRRAGTHVPAPRGMVGVCVGPGAVLGQGVRVAAGRAIAPMLTILPDPAGIVVHPDAPEGRDRVAVRDGGLQ